MYERFYKLREKPFNMTPDPEFLFFTEKHKEAFAHLVYGIRERRGFIEVTGEVGAGKTTICRALLNEFDADTKIALILNPFLSDIELLRAINEELYIDASGRTKKDLLDTLNRHLIDQHAAGRNVVLLIDEAQNLPPETLEQIRLISNLETVKAKLIQIVLVGQPELRAKLANPELRQLNQRITVRYHIAPLSRQETEDYIYHRLRVAGDQGGVHFVNNAIDYIYKYTGGIPRTINILCDHALLSGFVHEKHEIDLDLVKQARQEVEGKQPGRLGTWRSRLARHSLAYGAFAAVVLVAVAFSAGRGSLPLPESWKSVPVAIASAITGDKAPYSEVEAATLVPVLDATPVSVTPGSDWVNLSTVATAIEQAGKPDPSALAVAEPVVEESTRASVEPETTIEPERFASVPASEQPVPEAPTEPVELGRFDANGVLRCAHLSETRRAALLTLARLWIQDEEKLEQAYSERPAGTSSDWATATFELFGLAPISWSTNLAMVRAIDLPAVAEVYGTALFTPSYLTVVGLEGGEVIVADPQNGQRRLSEQEFSQQWFGHLTVLVPKNVKPEAVLGLRSGGQAVRFLQIRLKKLGLFEAEPNGLYDSYTVEQVRRFQQQNRIKIDGLVGLETNLVLFSRLAGVDAPRLLAYHARRD